MSFVTPVLRSTTRGGEEETERALIDVYAKELTLRVNNEAVTFNLDQTLIYSANYNDMTVNRIDVIDMACEAALIDVYPVELTLRVNNEPVTFNLDQTSRYSANYNDMTANRIDVIDMACEEYSQEVLGFFDVIASGNLTPYYDPIVSTSSPTLTPFGDSDFLLEEVDAFLALEDDPTSPKVDHSYYDTEGDILFLEAFLNDDQSLPPPTKGMYLPQDLPPHLEYAFLEGDDKLPVIISKDLCVEEKAALIKVLKSHKQAIAWKLSDIKDIRLLEEFLNDDPSSTLPPKELKNLEPKTKKSSIDKPPEVELKTYLLILSMNFWRVPINYPS
nr:reverse transcriptase domain-containing protein [Tanacetum cinerariifolium]